jgi:hypothetical protein
MKGPAHLPPIFRDDQLEIDSNSLTQALVLVARAQTAGRYRGQVLSPDGTMRWFSLSVVPAPAERSVVVDVAGTWADQTTFSVEVNGYLVIMVGKGLGGQKVIIDGTAENAAPVFDNTKLKQGNTAVLRLFRPGKHQLSDLAHGNGTCEVTVTYPTPLPPNTPPSVSVAVVRDEAGRTSFQPKAITASPLQAVAVSLQDGTHLVSQLIAVTDVVDGRQVTTDVKLDTA